MMKSMPDGTSQRVRAALTRCELECAVDEYGLASILEALRQICIDKAEHLETNWQDKIMAQFWDSRAAAIEQLASKPFMEDK